MSEIRDDGLLRAAFAPARALEPTAGEIAAVLERALPSRGRFRGGRLRPAAIGLAVLALAGGGAYAVPATRAGIDGVVGTFSDWAGGRPGEAPGRPLAPGEDAAAYLRDLRYSRDPRVLAEAGGYRLYAAREPGGTIEFDLGNTGVGSGGWKPSDFAGHALYVLGPGSMQHADAHGHVPLFGVTARSVASVELVYPAGPPLRVDRVAGGFVLLADPARDAREVVAFDARGRELERASLHNTRGHKGVDIHWEDYGRPTGR
jgi:hypothetical protein